MVGKSPIFYPTLHPGQAEVWDARVRYRVLACGRRWGKTKLGALMCVHVGLTGRRAWWVAPTYKMAIVGWRELVGMAYQIPGADIHKSDMAVEFAGGGAVTVRSADNPQSLRGEGLDFAVLDECAFMAEDAWREALRPALSDRRGGAMFISTPKGHNWFWRLYQRGQDNQDREWASWQKATAENPFIDGREIEAAKRDLPERIFAQEYLAQFLDDAGGVFRGVMRAATATEAGPVDGHDYIMGVDWGKHEDFTVLSLIDASTASMVAMDRFQQIDYTLQTGRLKALADRYQPRAIVAEQNSMGDPLIEQLRRDHLPVQAFLTTNATKAAIIEGLALAFERDTLAILPDPVLIGELQAYEMERLPSGLMRYGAPSGVHDDCVMSLALAWYGASKPKGVYFA